MAERWSESSPDRPRRGADSLEQGLDRLVTAGRQLVDGVSGARPGSRAGARAAAPAAVGRPRLGDLGRWVENKLDWILEDDDAWREPWQAAQPPSQPRSQFSSEPRSQPSSQPQARSAVPRAEGSRRRPLEAISRRGQRPQPSQSSASGIAPAPASEDWLDDTSFSRPRWQRTAPAPAMPPVMPPARQPQPSQPQPGQPLSAESPERPMPRSSRRRQP